MLNKKMLALGAGLTVGVIGCVSTVLAISSINSKPSDVSVDQKPSNSEQLKRDAFLDYKDFVYGVNVSVENLEAKTIYDWMKVNQTKVFDLINVSGSADEYNEAKFQNVDFSFWDINLGPNSDYSSYVRNIQKSTYVSGTHDIYEATLDIFAKPKNGHTWISDGTATTTAFSLILSNITINK